MANETFGYVASLFGGKTISEEERTDLFREMLILALSRMTRADLSIDAVEVDSVIKYVASATGANISDATVRTAASSELFETAPLDKQLQKVSKHLTGAQKRTIVQGLADVIGSDGHVSDAESELFDSLVGALNLTPSQLYGFGV